MSHTSFAAPRMPVPVSSTAMHGCSFSSRFVPVRRLLVVLSSLAVMGALLQLSGCATQPGRVSPARLLSGRPVNPPQPAVFEVEGKMSARAKGKNITVFMTWARHDPCTVIQIEGVFGFGASQLKACPGDAVLNSPFTGEKRGTSLEKLMQEKTGYVVPLSHIDYWLNGVAATPAAAIKLDPQRRAQSIAEDNWQATFSYAGPDALRPSRIEIVPLPAAVQGSATSRPVPEDTRIVIAVNRRSENAK